MFANLIRILASFFLVTALFGCGGGGGGSGSSGEVAVDARSVKLTDFNFDLAENLDRYELAEAINGEEDFTFDHPLSNIGDDGLDACIVNLIDSSSVDTDLGGGVYELYTTPVDVVTCTSSHEDPGFNYNEFVFSVYAKGLVVDGSDNPIENLDAVDATLSDNYNLKESTIKVMARAKGTYTYYGDVYNITSTVRSMISKVNSDLPCSEAFGSSLLDDCTSRTIVNYGVEGQDSYADVYALTYNNVQYIDGQPYYFGGTITFKINNWSGVMTYDATDPSIRPTWTATSSDGEMASGTLYYTP